MLAQPVVNRDAFKHVAAWRVDVHGDGLVADGSQCRVHSLHCDALSPPILANDPVHGDGVGPGFRGSTYIRIPHFERTGAQLAAKAAGFGIQRHGYSWSWPSQLFKAACAACPSVVFPN
ncbi:hypothetical protein D3C76_1513190 [compost metagenome]